MSTEPGKHAGKQRDSLFFNKIAGGVLSAGLIVWIGYHLFLFMTEKPEPKKEVVAATAPATAPAPTSGVPSIDNLILKADVKKGEAFVQQQCAACHTLTKGGANGVGPNLYGVMGAPMFAGEGFSFSDAAKKVASGNWTYQKMNEWLVDPMKMAPGTRMGYPGIKNDQQRADVVAYLRTLAATPIPLPKPQAATEAAEHGVEGSGAPSISALYASADASKGQSFFEQQCSACHTITKGGANGVGPNLYGVVGGPMFAHGGFSFTDAAKKHAHGNWTPQELNEWLYDPMKDVPGTRMGYPGIKNDQLRADVIAYLNSQSANPVKLP